MTLPPFARPLPAAEEHSGRSLSQSRCVRDETGRASMVMRKFQIASLARNGAIYTTDQIGPAIPLFEAAFSAFAHGTLIKTTEGMTAVEDLQPGMQIITAERGPMPLLWVGSMVLVPKREEPSPETTRLTRIMAGSFGPARPATDLMAGPGARLLTRPSVVHDIVGADHILTPANALVDGVNVIEITPPRPVNVYHLCLQRHATITAAGLEVETYHPGSRFESELGPNMLSLFLSFFPHIHAPSDFGPLAHPRVSATGKSDID